MQKLAPGFYADANGNLHVDPSEICEAAGVPYTAANYHTVVKTALAECRATWPDTKFTQISES
jgi:hypothetical protein